MSTLHQGQLVVTHDGHYAIVTSVMDRTVFCSNGCDFVLTEAEWEQLKTVPMKVGEVDTIASFIGIERQLVDRRP